MVFDDILSLAANWLQILSPLFALLAFQWKASRVCTVKLVTSNGDEVLNFVIPQRALTRAEVMGRMAARGKTPRLTVAYLSTSDYESEVDGSVAWRNTTLLIHLEDSEVSQFL